MFQMPLGSHINKLIITLIGKIYFKFAIQIFISVIAKLFQYSEKIEIKQKKICTKKKLKKNEEDSKRENKKKHSNKT